MLKRENINFIKESAIFIATLIVFMILFNIIYFHIFIQKKQLYRNEIEFDSFVNSKEKNIPYLFFGSSHTKDGANPMYLNGSFNLATGGEGTFILAYYTLRKIVEVDHIKVNTLIIEIDPHILNDRAYPEPFYIENLWYWSDFLSYTDIKNITSLSYTDYLLQSNLYFMNGAKDLSIFFNGGKISNTFHGWSPNNENFSRNADQEGYIDQYYKVTFKNTNSSLNPLGSDYLLKTLKLAQKNNIKIIFIKYPLSPGYIKRIQESGFNLTDYYNNIITLCNKSNIRFQILDYQEVFTDNSIFGDPGHLNVEGSKIITNKIREDLEGKNKSISELKFVFNQDK